MNPLIGILVSIFVLLSASCSKSVSDQDAAKQRWKSKGWTYFETFGPAVPDAVYIFEFSGETASAVTAGITVDGISKEKEYKQDTEVYAIVGFQSPKTGNGYAMIFKKRK